MRTFSTQNTVLFYLQLEKICQDRYLKNSNLSQELADRAIKQVDDRKAAKETNKK